MYLDGYHGDTSETFLVGQVDETGQRLVETARRCRDEAIAACKPGAQLCVIGNTIRYTLCTRLLLLIIAFLLNASFYYD